MENRSVKSTPPEELQQWIDNAVISLSASLVFGKDKARQIAQPLLIALFNLTSNDFKKALEIIGCIDDFSVKRIFLEQFKYCYIVNTGSEDLSALVTKVDFSDQQMSYEYDSVLFKLYNENNKDFASLNKSLGVLPIRAKRVALRRLYSKEFERFKKIKITPKWPSDHSRQPLIRTWHWILICLGIAAMTLTKID